MAFHYSPNIVTDGLVLYLDAANTKSFISGSTTCNDISRGGNNGVLTNNPTYNSLNGGNIVFDGVDDFMSIPDSESFNFGSNDFTIEFWITFLGTLSNSRTIISQSNGNVAPIWIGRLTNNLSVWASNNGSSWNVLTNALGFTLSLDTWFHITITRIGNSWTSYKNGVQQSTTISSGTLYNSTDNMVFAYRQLDGYTNCKLGSLKIYNNKGLSSSEVSQNYNTTKSRFGL